VPKPTEFQDYLDKFNLAQMKPWNEDRWIKAADDMFNRYFAQKQHSVQPLRGRDVRSYVRNLNSSAGLSFDGDGFSRIFRFKHDVPRRHIDREINRWMGQGFIDVPTTIAFRRHLVQGDKHKVRTVFVTPAAVSFAEAFFSVPITRLFKSLGMDHPIGTGFNWLEGDGRLLEARFPAHSTASADVSDFDISAKIKQVRYLFELVRRLLQLNTWEDKLFRLLADYQCETIIRYAGRLVRLKGGIRSGSGFTHIIGCLLNMTLVVCGSGQRRALKFKVFGDDLILHLSDAQHWEDFVRGCHDCGFTISEAKSVIGEIHWLGFNVSTGVPKLLNVDKWWAGFLHPERPDESMGHHKTRLAGYILSSLGDDRFLRDACIVWNELFDVKAVEFSGTYLFDEQITELDDLNNVCRRLWRKVA